MEVSPGGPGCQELIPRASPPTSPKLSDFTSISWKLEEHEFLFAITLDTYLPGKMSCQHIYPATVYDK